MKYYLYVIELDRKVGKFQKFRAKNPNFIFGSSCFYVGQSAKIPTIRFKQHSQGYKSNNYVKKFGIRLIPELYEKYNPIPSRKDALELERYLSLKLREKGFGVWFS